MFSRDWFYGMLCNKNTSVASTESAVKTTKTFVRKMSISLWSFPDLRVFSQLDATQWRCHKRHERHLAVKLGIPVLLNFYSLSWFLMKFSLKFSFGSGCTDEKHGG